MAEHSVAKPADVLLAIVERIRAQVPTLNDPSLCYLSLSPQLPMPTTSSIFCQVTPMAGEFESAALDGALAAQCFDATSVLVTIFCGTVLDEAGHDAEWLTHSTLGVLETARLVAKALTGWQAALAAAPSVLLTRQPIIPLSHTQPEREQRMGAIGLVFEVEFDWDLAS